MNLLTGIQSTSSALNAERVRMEVVSQNIANANVTNFKDGKPYRRQVVTFESALQDQMGAGATGASPEAVQVAKILDDTRPPRMVHNPSDPVADSNGWVATPNINIHEEMADMITSSRAFEANLAVVKASRNLTMQTLSIGKRS